jgi:hypothetical protein
MLKTSSKPVVDVRRVRGKQEARKKPKPNLGWMVDSGRRRLCPRSRDVSFHHRSVNLFQAPLPTNPLTAGCQCKTIDPFSQNQVFFFYLHVAYKQGFWCPIPKEKQLGYLLARLLGPPSAVVCLRTARESVVRDKGVGVVENWCCVRSFNFNTDACTGRGIGVLRQTSLRYQHRQQPQTCSSVQRGTVNQPDLDPDQKPSP